MHRRILFSLALFGLLAPALGTGCNKGKDPDNPKLVGPVDTSAQPIGQSPGGKGNAPKSGGNKSLAQ